jgi:ubiquinone/menaquinone biosynthesis C-methylase UbiE
LGGEDPYRQVLRTSSRQPIGAAGLARVANHAVGLLELGPDHRVLDLCCGNGLLGRAIEARCRRLVGADFCLRLLREGRERTTQKTVTVAADGRFVPFRPASFDRVLVAAALQHFELGEVVRLFRAALEILRPEGVLVVTDIPNRARMWRFHDTEERENAYFEAEAKNAPILGTWFDRAWLGKLGRYAGFRESATLEQPADFPYAHYRFDLRCRL